MDAISLGKVALPSTHARVPDQPTRLCASGPQGRRDAICSLVGGLVFPDADDQPAGFREATVGVAIALYVRLEFRFPPLAIVLRDGPVLRTRVPEATVDEYRDALLREDDVDASSRGRQDLAFEPVAQAATVQFSAERECGLGVLTRLAPKPLPCRLVERARCVRPA